MSQTAEWIDKSESECSTSMTSSHQVEPTGLFGPQVTMSNASTNACVCVCQRACATHSVLTAVGELHSLTDWQVSEASEEAELVDFWRKGRRERRKQTEENRRDGVRRVGEVLMSFRQEVFSSLKGPIQPRTGKKKKSCL